MRWVFGMIRLTVLAAVMLGLGPGSAAGAEQLTIQIWGGVWEEAIRAVGDPFAKKLGVEIRYEQQTNTRIGLSQIWAQKNNPRIDVFLSAADAMEQATDEGLLAPINPGLIPALASVPKQAVHKASIDYSYILFGLVYRKDLAPFELTRWEDLLDPRLKGKIASNNAQYGSGRWLIMAALINGGSEKNIEPGFESIKKMKPNIVSFGNPGELLKAIQSGEAAVVPTLIFSEVHKLLGPNSPYRFVLPEGRPVMTNVNAVGIPNPKNAALAHKFIDYLLSSEGQQAYCWNIACTPIHPQAQVPEVVRAYRPPAHLIHQMDWSTINKNLAAWDDRFKKEVQTR